MTSGRRLDAFQRVAVLTTAATYLLIAVGGLVRATGSGLGCPDWPKCFGRWIPPTRAAEVPAPWDASRFVAAQTWTEYLNRLMGATVGLLIFATVVLAFRHYRRAPRVLWTSVAAFLLVGFEGWLGKVVVDSNLQPLKVTVHLVGAVLVVTLLLYATFAAVAPLGPPAPARASPERRPLLLAVSAAGLVALAQLALGAALRGELQVLDAAVPEVPRGLWFARAGALAGLHKDFALFVALAVGGLAYLVHARAGTDRWIRGLADLSVALVLLQAGVGFGLASMAVPPALQVLHLLLGTLLLGTLFVVGLLALRLGPPASAPSPAAGAGR